MTALLLAFAYFSLGALCGAFATYVFWMRYKSQLMADVFKKMLAEQGYEIKNKHIVPREESAATATSDIDDALREVLEHSG